MNRWHAAKAKAAQERIRQLGSVPRKTAVDPSIPVRKEEGAKQKALTILAFIGGLFALLVGLALLSGLFALLVALAYLSGLFVWLVGLALLIIGGLFALLVGLALLSWMLPLLWVGSRKE